MPDTLFGIGENSMNQTDRMPTTMELNRKDRHWPSNYSVVNLNKRDYWSHESSSISKWQTPSNPLRPSSNVTFSRKPSPCPWAREVAPGAPTDSC